MTPYEIGNFNLLSLADYLWNADVLHVERDEETLSERWNKLSPKKMPVYVEDEA